MKDVLFLLGLVVVATVILVLGAIVLAIAVPLLITSCLVIWVLEYVGSGYARKRWGRLEFPIVTLKHDVSGRLVHLIGVMHIAQSDYWVTLSRIVENIKGVVLYELISTPSKDDLYRFTVAELSYYERIRAEAKTLRGEIAALLGLQLQNTGLSYPPHWIRTDMSGAEFVSLMSAIDERFPEKVGQIPKITEETKPFVRWFIQFILSHMPLFALVGEYFKTRDAYKRACREVVLNKRNAIGVQGILDHGKDVDVVAIWGAAHLPGMLKLLEGVGYCEIKKEWFCAWKPEPYSLVQMLRDVSRKS